MTAILTHNLSSRSSWFSDFARDKRAPLLPCATLTTFPRYINRAIKKINSQISDFSFDTLYSLHLKTSGDLKKKIEINVTDRHLWRHVRPAARQRSSCSSSSLACVTFKNLVNPNTRLYRFSLRLVGWNCCEGWVVRHSKKEKFLAGLYSEGPRPTWDRLNPVEKVLPHWVREPVNLSFFADSCPSPDSPDWKSPDCRFGASSGADFLA